MSKKSDCLYMETELGRKVPTGEKGTMTGIAEQTSSIGEVHEPTVRSKLQVPKIASGDKLNRSEGPYMYENYFMAPRCIDPRVDDLLDFEDWRPFAAVDERYLAVKEHQDDGIENLSEYNPILRGLATAYVFDGSYKRAYRILHKIHKDFEYRSFETSLMRFECGTAVGCLDLHDPLAEFSELITKLSKFTDESVERWGELLRNVARHVGRIVLRDAWYLYRNIALRIDRRQRFHDKGQQVFAIFPFFSEMLNCFRDITETFPVAAVDYAIVLLGQMVWDIEGHIQWWYRFYDGDSRKCQYAVIHANCCNVIACFCMHAGHHKLAAKFATVGIVIMEFEKNPAKYLVYGNLLENRAIANYCLARNAIAEAERQWLPEYQNKVRHPLMLVGAWSDWKEDKSANMERFLKKFGIEDDCRQAFQSYAKVVLDEAGPDYQKRLRKELQERVTSLRRLIYSCLINWCREY